MLEIPNGTISDSAFIKFYTLSRQLSKALKIYQTATNKQMKTNGYTTSQDGTIFTLIPSVRGNNMETKR